MTFQPSNPIEREEAKRRTDEDRLFQNQEDYLKRDASGFGGKDKLSKNEQAELEKFRKFCESGKDSVNDSGQGTSSRLPDELRGGSWPGLLLSMIWGLAMRIPWTWLCLVPVVGSLVPFVMFYRGNEWAWQYKRWDSIEHFRQVQHKWTVVGMILAFIVLIILVLYISWMDRMFRMLTGTSF